MLKNDFRERFTQLCLDQLGPGMGSRVAALVRDGFTLHTAGPEQAPTGRFRLGGPALLGPKDDWPESEDGPMTLLAVMDIDALAPGLDVVLPQGAGVLNIFFAGNGDRYDTFSGDFVFESEFDWKVVPADPETAAEVPPPPTALAPPARLVRAEPVPALPDPGRAYSGPKEDREEDPQLWEAFAQVTARIPEIAGADPNEWPFLNVPEDFTEDDDEDGHRAFGWPWPMQGGPFPGEHRVLLLQLDSKDGYRWADNGMITFDIDAAALREGDFSRVACYTASC